MRALGLVAVAAVGLGLVEWAPPVAAEASVRGETGASIEATEPTETLPHADTVPSAESTPLVPTLQERFPGLPAGITEDQLAAFFRFLAGPPVPEHSGQGRRIVYSNSAQRVWLVDAGGTVARTYLVSGRRSLPRLGVHRVFSKSRFASSGSVRMQYMVRFARGRNLAIGFHTIPLRRNGSPLQSLAQLGTPRSHGCVRQNPVDARQLWDWAPIGTTVVAVR